MEPDMRCQCPAADIRGGWTVLLPWLAAPDPRVREAAMHRAKRFTVLGLPAGAVPTRVWGCLVDSHADVRSMARSLLWGDVPTRAPVWRLRVTRGRDPRTWPILSRDYRCDEDLTIAVIRDLTDLLTDTSCEMRATSARRLGQALARSRDKEQDDTATKLGALLARLPDALGQFRRTEPCPDAARDQDVLLIRIGSPEVASAAAGRLAAGGPRDRMSLPVGPYRDEARQQSDPDAAVRKTALEEAHRHGRAWAWAWPPSPSSDATTEDVWATFASLWKRQGDHVPDRVMIQARSWADVGTVLPKDDEKRRRLLSLIGVAADRSRALSDRFTAVRSISDEDSGRNHATSCVRSDVTLAVLAEVADSPALPEQWELWTKLCYCLPVIFDGHDQVTSTEDMIGLGDLPPRHMPPSDWMLWWDVTDPGVGGQISGQARYDPLWTSAMTRAAVRAAELLVTAADGGFSDRDVARLSRVAAFAPGRTRCLYSPDGRYLGGGRTHP